MSQPPNIYEHQGWIRFLEHKTFAVSLCSCRYSLAATFKDKFPDRILYLTMPRLPYHSADDVGEAFKEALNAWIHRFDTFPSNPILLMIAEKAMGKHGFAVHSIRDDAGDF